jgi:hypothetical protein
MIYLFTDSVIFRDARFSDVASDLAADVEPDREYGPDVDLFDTERDIVLDRFERDFFERYLRYRLFFLYRSTPFIDPSSDSRPEFDGHSKSDMIIVCDELLLHGSYPSE